MLSEAKDLLSAARRRSFASLRMTIGKVQHPIQKMTIQGTHGIRSISRPDFSDAGYGS
jgi:hypothetical protein